MTSQPPQDEVEEVARAKIASNLFTVKGRSMDEVRRFAAEGRRLAFKPDGLQDALEFRTFGYDLIIAMAEEIDRLRSAAPAEGKDSGVAAGAAPLTKELLSRLCEAVDYVEDAVRGWPGGSLEREVAVSVFDRCQSAIAKATAPVDEAAEPLRSEPKASEPVPSLPTPPKDEPHG